MKKKSLICFEIWVTTQSLHLFYYSLVCVQFLCFSQHLSWKWDHFATIIYWYNLQSGHNRIVVQDAYCISSFPSLMRKQYARGLIPLKLYPDKKGLTTSKKPVSV